MTEPKTPVSTDRQSQATAPKPELDETRWQAWVQKNHAKDRIRAARRKRILGVLAAVAAVVLVVLKVMGLLG